LPRDAAAVAAAVAALDAAALAERADITRPFARTVIARLYPERDGSVADGQDASPAGRPLG
ncbi:hypothetical protein, partial [Falsiroseomonas oryziterrae]|uniref:hypothetical protein n=1 Tax=Falsiroseomonas oryziterrae TaxID=2911368 RepID=UPI001F1DBB45